MKSKIDYNQANLELIARYRAAENPRDQDAILAEILKLNNGLIRNFIQNGIRIRNRGGEEKLIGLNRKYLAFGIVDTPFLFSCGNEGLIEAVKTYDESRGASFGTYARFCVLKSIQAGLREIDPVSESIRQTCSKIIKLRDRGESYEEISRIFLEDSGKMYTPGHLKFLLRLEEEFDNVLCPTQSLEELTEEETWAVFDGWIDSDGDLVEVFSRGEAYVATEDHAVSHTACVVLGDQLEEVLSTLPERQGKALRLRFGLDRGYSRTLEEVGEILEVTKERVRQLEAKALKRLRHPSKGKRLADYFPPDSPQE